jgi:hypothetical protein
MKAKLFTVTQGNFSEKVIAKSKADAMSTVETSAMGLRKAILLGNVEIEANQTTGVTSYKLLNDKMPADFGANATIGNELYSELPE